MLSKFWQWIAGALATVAAVLYIWLEIVAGQRDKARKDALDAKRKANVLDAIAKAQAEAEKESKRVKDAGEKVIAEAIDRAESGDRSHFE